MYFSSISRGPIFNRTFVYKLMPAVVVHGKFRKYCTYIIKILKLMIQIADVYKVEHGIKYYIVVKCVCVFVCIYIYIYISTYSTICCISRVCCLDYSLRRTTDNTTTAGINL